MTYKLIILAAAKAAKVSGSLLLAICTYESGGKNVTVLHDGGSPSYGICQMKYTTAKMLGYKGQAKGLMVPEVNAKWAASYLAYQQERYKTSDWHVIAASYNAGSYNPSSKVPGCPRNLKYINRVKKLLDDELKYKMKCGVK